MIYEDIICIFVLITKMEKMEKKYWKPPDLQSNDFPLDHDCSCNKIAIMHFTLYIYGLYNTATLIEGSCHVFIKQILYRYRILDLPQLYNLEITITRNECIRYMFWTDWYRSCIHTKRGVPNYLMAFDFENPALVRYIIYVLSSHLIVQHGSF